MAASEASPMAAASVLLWRMPVLGREALLEKSGLIAQMQLLPAVLWCLLAVRCSCSRGVFRGRNVRCCHGSMADFQRYTKQACKGQRRAQCKKDVLSEHLQCHLTSSKKRWRKAKT